MKKKITAVCVYCGDLATCRDHIVPYLYSGTSTKRRSGFDPGRTVPACAICNSTLSSKLFQSWEERCHFIWEWRFRKGLPIFNTGSYESDTPVNDNTRNCVGCGYNFISKNARQIWCSIKCRNDHFHKRATRIAQG